MPNGGITRKTFESATTEGKLSILFDQQLHIIESMRCLKNKDSDINDACRDRMQKCDQRFKVLEISWAKLAGGILILAVIVPIISTIIIKSIF